MIKDLSGCSAVNYFVNRDQLQTFQLADLDGLVLKIKTVESMDGKIVVGIDEDNNIYVLSIKLDIT